VHFIYLLALIERNLSWYIRGRRT